MKRYRQLKRRWPAVSSAAVRQGWYRGRYLALVLAFALSSLIQPAMMVAPAPAATQPADNPTGGHLGWPVSPAIDLRSAADAHVTPA